jgi:hypothetical protein
MREIKITLFDNSYTTNFIGEFTRTELEQAKISLEKAIYLYIPRMEGNYERNEI